MAAQKVCVFDAYGTLFDVNAAARDLARSGAWPGFSDHWQTVSADWRAKQLEYSWLRAITGDHCDFWRVTQDGLDWALERAGLQVEAQAGLRTALLDLYWRLGAFPEVAATLDGLRARGLPCAILSNGSREMLDAAVTHAGLQDRLDRVMSVDDVGIFKPAAAVYDMVGAQYGVGRGDVLFVSSNGWDIASAASYGFHTVWVNRAGAPIDRLGGRPEVVLQDLSAVCDTVEALGWHL